MHCETLSMPQDDAGAGTGIYARRRLPAGSRVYVIGGSLVSTPSRMSLQIGASLHVEPYEGEWCLLRHSCDPCLRVDFSDWSFRAIRDIAEDEELTFNYLTTEARMAAPFDCRCGFSGCFGRIAGFALLGDRQKALLNRHVAAHMRSDKTPGSAGCIFGSRPAVDHIRPGAV